MSSYALFARHLTRAAVSEKTRQRTYLHSTDMRSRPSYSVYRSEPVHGSRPNPLPWPRLFVVDPRDYEMAANFARRRYDSVKVSVDVEMREPRRPALHSYTRLSVDVETRQPRRTHKNARFDDGVNYEIRYPSSEARSRNTRDSDIRYETRVPGAIYSGLRGVSCSGRRVLGHRGQGACPWF
ncbi:unnamed protein product [Penicillium nalgiovense]|nr:unnamed protein product [Penicillium nalgiovense]